MSNFFLALVSVSEEVARSEGGRERRSEGGEGGVREGGKGGVKEDTGKGKGEIVVLKQVEKVEREREKKKKL